MHGNASGRGGGIRLGELRLDAVGAEFVRDIAPGEVVTVDSGGIRCDTSHCGQTPRSLCVFEYIYFSRPDSTVDGACVSLARQQAGAFLALEHPVQADVVIGVPDSGLDAAMGYARASGIPYAKIGISGALSFPPARSSGRPAWTSS